ncbi:MAG: DUF2304 domain-containing protein [Bacteroidota bacterium]
MKPIQFILILMITGIGYTLIKHFARRKLFQFLVGFLLVAGIFLILFFDYSTYLANFLGIGRGVDLILYVGLTGLMMVCLLLYRRILTLEDRITQIVREDSLEDSQSSISP